MEDPTTEPTAPPIKRGRGRPPGVKNKRQDSMTQGAGRLVPPTASKDDDFAYADPATMLARQLSMISWQQQALRIKMMGASGRLHGIKPEEALMDVRSGGRTTDPADTKELLDLSNSLVRAIEAMKKHMDMAKDLAAMMSPEELLEAALAKLEGQSLPTLNYAIKRLRAKREQLAPVLGLERFAIGNAEEDKPASQVIADLMKE